MSGSTYLGAAGPESGELELLRPACLACSPVSAYSSLDRAAVTSPDAGAELLRPYVWSKGDREVCAVAYLDTKHRLLSVDLLSVGSVDHTFVNPREVMRGALLAGAAAIVLAHNHPSGDAEPSRDDELVTRRVASAGQIVGVELLDHLVIGADRWVSLARRGVL